MVRTVMATKVHMPGVRVGLTSRPRLADALGESRHAQVVLLSAPAGFGKTTLLSQWLSSAASDDLVAWLSLDPTDSDPEAFWSGILAALRAADRNGSLNLDAACAEPLIPDAVVPALVNALDVSSLRVWLVLDDYHLIEGAVVNDGVTALIEHAPQNVHIVLSTRIDPNMPLARWRARRQLLELRSADLRFSLAEADDYFSASGLELTPADVAVLEERTEGWAAALQLAALSLRGRIDASGFIARFAGDDRYVVDYLADEVLRGQSADVRDFLLRTSVLHRLTGPLCDAVTGASDGASMLTTLERANMFVIPLDDRREWFRYHHLFADVLRAFALAEIPDQVEMLHRRASRWFEQQGLLDEAIAHALAGRDFTAAGYLIENAIPAIRRERREAVLATWLRELPEDVVLASPVLSAFAAFGNLADGDIPAALSLLARADELLAQATDPPSAWADTDELRTLPATIASYRAAIAQAAGDLALMREQAQRVIDFAGPDDHMARGAGGGFLALAAWSEGEIADAVAAFDLAIRSLAAAGNVIDELISTVALADMWIVAGQPREAGLVYTAALAKAEAYGDGARRAAAALHVGASQLDVAAGDADSARAHLELAAALADPRSMGEITSRWHVALADAAVAGGDFVAALEHLADAASAYRPGFLPDVRPIDAVMARVHIRQGDLQAARAWAAAQPATRARRSAYLREYDELTVVRLHIAEYQVAGDLGSLRDDDALLQRMADHARHQRRLGSFLEIGVVRAANQVLRADIAGAVETLCEAVDAVPEPERYAAGLIEFAPLLAPVLAACESRSRNPQAVRALAGLVGGTSARSLTTSTGPPGGPASLSERELDVLRMLDTDLTGPEIARHLYISHNTMRTHTKRIFTKLNVTGRRASVTRARELGLI